MNHCGIHDVWYSSDGCPICSGPFTGGTTSDRSSVVGVFLL